MPLTIYFPPHMYRAIGLVGLLPFVRFFRITRFQRLPLEPLCLFGLPLGNAWEELWARQWMKEGFDNWGWRNLIQRAGRFRTLKSWRRCKLNENLFLSPFPLLLCLFGFWLLKVLCDLFTYNYMWSAIRTKNQKSKSLKWAENLQSECLGMRLLFLKELQHSLEISNRSSALSLATRATHRIRNQSDLQGRKNWRVKKQEHNEYHVWINFQSSVHRPFIEKDKKN